MSLGRLLDCKATPPEGVCFPSPGGVSVPEVPQRSPGVCRRGCVVFVRGRGESVSVGVSLYEHMQVTQYSGFDSSVCSWRKKICTEYLFHFPSKCTHRLITRNIMGTTFMTIILNLL